MWKLLKSDSLPAQSLFVYLFSDFSVLILCCVGTAASAHFK